jgi:type IV pilus assembly protein PilC
MMLNNNELSTLFKQLGMLIHSGVSTIEAISIIRDDMNDPKGKELLHSIYERLDMGEDFSVVLQESGEFPKYAVDMILIGSYSGKLDDVLSALASYYEREEQIGASIRGAITYPVLMIFMLFIVVGVLITRVLPIFQDVYLQLGTELTGAAGTLMNLGNIIQNIIPQIIIGLLIIVGILFYLGKKKSGIFKNVFINRKLSQAIAVGRFANGMSLTLSSGLDTDESLKMTGELTDHPVIQKKIAKCREQLEAGVGFSEAITSSELFNNTQNRMIKIGMKAGTLDQVMENVSNQCSDETDRKIQHLLSVLEPTLVAILAIIVGVMLLSIMLPLMGIMANMGM